MYHSVSDKPSSSNPLWSISPATLSCHLEYLKYQHWVPTTVSTFVSLLFDKKEPLPDKTVVITFDDGLADFFTGALPILVRYGYPATLFITTAYINQSAGWLRSRRGENHPMLSWSEVREIADHGIECGSHAHSHAQLDILPVKKIRDELRNSKDILEQHLLQSVQSFAYPFGLNSPNLRQLVQQAGYSSACAVRHTMASAADDRYALARIVITSETSPEKFNDYLHGKGLRKSKRNERTRTKVFRLFRKIKYSIIKDKAYSS
jgi:peptidoglycan/xylan/chitin deacetylase (PgdA/CDA1 family)